MSHGDPRELITLTRDCEVVEIPSGSKSILPKGSQVMIEQSLGGTYTVLTDRGAMVRVDSKDNDALGLAETETSKAAAVDPTTTKEVESRVWEELKTCFDPEIPVNIVDLGLIYGCQVAEIPDGGYKVDVTMTLTAPGCGMGDILKEDAEGKILSIPGVKGCLVELVFEPVWDPSRMSEVARLQLNMM